VRIAPEGWPFIAIAWLLVAGAAYLGNRWGGPWWIAPALLAIVAIWVVSFFRDPIRPGPRGEDGEPIELRPPGWLPDEGEVVEALPVEPEPQLDDTEGE